MSKLDVEIGGHLGQLDRPRGLRIALVIERGRTRQPFTQAQPDLVGRAFRREKVEDIADDALDACRMALHHLQQTLVAGVERGRFGE